MSVCRSCNAAVIFRVNVKRGRRQILDAAPHPKGNVELIDADTCRTLTRAELDTPSLLGERVLYHDHHVTCPQARQWDHKVNRDRQRVKA